MAKVAFSKLGCQYVEEVKNIEFNGEVIEIKQHLPIQDKLGMISRVLKYAHEQDSNYANPVKVDVVIALEFVFSYTNISFTKTQMSDFAKLYDALKMSGLLDNILNNIPKEEYELIYNGVIRTVESFYSYKNSFIGVLDVVGTQKDNFSFNLNQIKEEIEEIKDPEVLKLLKDITALTE